MGRVLLHMRKRVPLFHILGTTGRIVIKFDVWLEPHYLWGLLQNHLLNRLRLRSSSLNPGSHSHLIRLPGRSTDAVDAWTAMDAVGCPVPCRVPGLEAEGAVAGRDDPSSSPTCCRADWTASPLGADPRAHRLTPHHHRRHHRPRADWRCRHRTAARPARPYRAAHSRPTDPAWPCQTRPDPTTGSVTGFVSWPSYRKSDGMIERYIFKGCN